MKTKNKYELILWSMIVIAIFFAIESNAQSQTLRKVQNDAFTYGERLEYKVGYGAIQAGTGFFHVMPQPITRANNRKCYDIRFQVNSLESLRWIYQVDNGYRTVLDQEGIFPWEFQQRIREGKYKKDARAEFDQINNVAIVKNKPHKVPPYVHDIVSAFFYVRTMDLRSMSRGQVFKLENFFDNKTYELGVKVHGRQTVEVEAGKFRCIVIEPMVMEGGLFKHEGTIYIWLTDDDRKIPVKVTSKILIGSVSAELVNYSGLAGPINAKLN